MKYNTVIIDPASTEFNRGSFCYLPYILYSSMRANNKKVKLIENFTVADIDNLPEADNYYIALWSEPQIEICTVLKRYLRGNVKFFGYYALIKEFHFPVYIVPDTAILKGIINYPKYYKDFKYLLLSDCDMHLSKYEGQVYPLCTSYGCPMGCNFCPSTVNCNRNRIWPDMLDVQMMFDSCVEQGVTNIHFTDEDFFWDKHRAYAILSWIEKSDVDFQLIAMAHVGTLLKFVDEYGVDIIDRAGLKLIEVGFETADEKLAKDMGKVKLAKYIELAGLFKKTEANIFWLTLSFFPGETISSLNKTGEFLREYGYKMEELYGRIQTNSTEGGLGQFFQWYAGVKDYEKRQGLGLNITSRRIRLIPSFIPMSLLDDRIHAKVDLANLNKSTYDFGKWFDLYNLPNLLPSPIEFNTMKMGEALCHMVEVEKLCTIEEGITYLAICCRLNFITS